MDASLTAGGEWSAVHARQEGLQVQAVGACGVVCAVVIGEYVGADHAVTPRDACLDLRHGERQAAAQGTDC